MFQSIGLLRGGLGSWFAWRGVESVPVGGMVGVCRRLNCGKTLWVTDTSVISCASWETNWQRCLNASTMIDEILIIFSAEPS
jgi:hypothetical protein